MRRFLNFGSLLPLLVVLALVFAFWGWSVQAEALGLTIPDIFFRGLGSLAMSNNYDDRAFFNNDWRVDTARVLGGLAFMLAASQAVARLLSTRASRWFGRFRRGHLLVVGDHPVARGIVEKAVARAATVTWLSNGLADDGEVPGALVVPRPWDAALALEFGAAAARRCVIACVNEVEQISAARDLRQAVPQLPVTMNFADPWFADLMDRQQHITGVRFVSQALLAVRDLHWRHPPFRIAQSLGHDSIHALIFGFGRGGEAALTDLLLSSGAGFLGRPRVTIVDPRANEIRASLAQRCPGLPDSVDLDFIDLGRAEDIRLLPVDALAAAQQAAPVTMATVCVDGDARSMALAVSLQALAGRLEWPMGPIFVRLVSGSALPSWRAGSAVPRSGTLVGFGAIEDFAHAVGLFDKEVDQLPRLFHEAYRRAVPDHAVANAPWAQLSEEMRESNRRLVAHLPAKLATAGLDVEGWMADPRAHHFARLLPDLSTDPALLDRIAAVEHARWMAERHLGGWQYGPQRDNVRRHHPDLKPYAELEDSKKAYDRAVVAETWAALRSAAVA
jgi:hypothetical protein